jgi:Flp pilus assembly protein TadG
VTPRRRLISSATHFRGTDYGGAMVEFAVVFPVLVLLLIGAADFGRVFFTAIAVSNAARAGAEMGARTSADAFGPATNITNFAASDGADAGSITLSTVTTCRCGETDVSCAGTPLCVTYGPPRVFVEVTASKSVGLLIPYPGVTNPVLVSRKATFRAQ